MKSDASGSAISPEFLPGKIDIDYPDIDMRFIEKNELEVFVRRDGTPYETKDKG